MKKGLPKKITDSYLHNAGLYYLQRFSTSTENFRRVMTQKISRSCRAHEDQDINECMQMLEDLIIKFQRSGLLDDKNYAGGAIRSLRNKGESTRSILRKMQAKGIAPEVASETLQQHDSDHSINGDLTAAARYIQRRRLGVFSSRDNGDRSSKDLSSLARAGYGYEIAQKVLLMSREEIEDLLTANSG